jgi:hypothetical protein
MPSGPSALGYRCGPGLILLVAASEGYRFGPARLQVRRRRLRLLAVAVQMVLFGLPNLPGDLS